jgi:hypothetical protein
MYEHEDQIVIAGAGHPSQALDPHKGEWTRCPPRATTERPLTGPTSCSEG